MTTNRIFNEIFFHDSSDSANKFKSAVRSAISSYLSNPANPVHVKYLNSQYWDMVYFVVKKKFMHGENFDFNFSDDEKIAIDFGYFSDALVENSQPVPDEVFRDTLSLSPALLGGDSPVRFYTLTGWLTHQLKEFTGVYTIEKLEKQYETSIFEVDASRQEKDRFVVSKRAIIEAMKKEFSENKLSQWFDKVLEQTMKIDELIDKYGMMKSRIQAEMMLSPEERVEFVGIENMIKTTREERKKIFRNCPQVSMKYNNDLLMLEDMIIQKEHEIFDLIMMIGKNKSNLENFIFSKREILNEKKDWFLRDKINNLRNNIEAISKSSKVEPMMFLTKAPQRNMPDQILSVMKRCMQADPGLFGTGVPPCVVFVPGRGKGDYISAINSIVLPQVPIRDIRDHVVSTIAVYRWESDDDCKLKNSFSALKTMRHMTSLAIEHAFVKNYCTFVTKVFEGYEAADFDKEMHEWFTTNISWRPFSISSAAGPDPRRDRESSAKAVQPRPSATETARPAGNQQAEKDARPGQVPSANAPGPQVRSFAKPAAAQAPVPSRKKLPGEFDERDVASADDPIKIVTVPSAATGSPVPAATEALSARLAEAVRIIGCAGSSISSNDSGVMEIRINGIDPGTAAAVVDLIAAGAMLQLRTHAKTKEADKN